MGGYTDKSLSLSRCVCMRRERDSKSARAIPKFEGLTRGEVVDVWRGDGVTALFMRSLCDARVGIYIPLVLAGGEGKAD